MLGISENPGSQERRSSRSGRFAGLSPKKAPLVFLPQPGQNQTQPRRLYHTLWRRRAQGRFAQKWDFAPWRPPFSPQKAGFPAGFCRFRSKKELSQFPFVFIMRIP